MSRGKGKGKPHWRTGYFADEGYWNEEPSYEHDSYHYDSYQDDARGGSYVGLFANDEQPGEDAPQDYAEEEVEEWEATALNALGDLAEDDPVDCTSLGEALQLELAALAAFGKASGKGKNKGKGKSTGKLVRSNLTLEQRRAKLAEIKSKSKCIRCGGTGHWAGDPACRFPNGKGKMTTPASQSKTAICYGCVHV